MLVRLTIFSVCSVLVAFAAHSFFGSIIFAAAQQETITLQDAYKNEVHELSGIVMVPSSCHDLTVRAKDVNVKVTAVIFETWEQFFRAECIKEPTPRAVHAIAFGPSDLDIKAIFDGEWVPLAIIDAP